ncbi:MAG: AAA family ATPase [Burkholderiales bacterium]|nr:AAA family ATPase [Burkholderiales bacterium]
MGDIEVTLSNYRCFKDEAPATFRIGSGFTAFVGQNNAGKSSALKFFYELRDIFTFIGPNGNFINLLRGKPEIVNARGVFEHTDIFCDLNSSQQILQLQLQPQYTTQNKGSPELSRLTLKIDRTKANQFCADIFRGPRYLRPSLDEFNSCAVKGARIINDATLLLECSQVFDFAKAIRNSIYIGPFRNAINSGATDYYDIQVGDVFAQHWDQWKSGNSKEQNRAIRRVTEDIKRIFGIKTLEISATPDKKTLHLTVDGRPFKLNELGAGVTQFILVLGNALIRSPDYIFIDEPELSLHPSLQIDFLTTLASYAKQGVVFATHSLGLARSLAPRIFTFQRGENGSIVKPFEQTPNYAEFLGEMSYSGYKELGYDRILLVEGVHDVSVAHQFLRMLGKDHKIVVIPLGGDQLAKGGVEIELGELKRLSSNIAALVDSEKTSETDPPKGERLEFKKTCEKLGFKVLLTERRAIENYFTDAAVKVVKSDKYSALQPFQRLKDAPQPWGKDENWRIAREMTFADIKDTDLGCFLSEI